MTRARGWATRGERPVAAVLFDRWSTMTFQPGLRAGGITAACVFDGPIHGCQFRAWVEPFLVVHTLRPGDIVVSTIWAATKAKPSDAPSATRAHLTFLLLYRLINGRAPGLVRLGLGTHNAAA